MYAMISLKARLMICNFHTPHKCVFKVAVHVSGCLLDTIPASEADEGKKNKTIIQHVCSTESLLSL